VLQIVKKLGDRQPVFKNEDGVIETVAEHIQLDVIQEQGIYLVYDEDANFIRECYGIAQRWTQRFNIVENN
jgi:hypothetical protein